MPAIPKTKLQSLLQRLSLDWPNIRVFDLHLFRFLFLLSLFFVQVSEWSRFLEKFRVETQWNPIPLFELWGWHRWTLPQLEWAYALLLGFLLLAAWGLWLRATLIVSAILYFLVHGQLLGLIKSPDSSYVSHSKNLLFFVLLVLALEPKIAHQSSLLTWWRNRQSLLKETISAQTLNLIIFLFGCAYFGASFIRLRDWGWQWMDGFTLKSHLMMAYFSEGANLAYHIAQHHYVSQFLAVAVIGFEISFLFAFVFFRPYFWLLMGSLGLHVAIRSVMKINFLPYHGLALLAFLIFPPFRLTDHLFKKSGNRPFLFNNKAKISTKEKAWRRSVNGLFQGVFLTCLFFQIESWPFTDWRVYSTPLKPEDVFYYDVVARHQEKESHPLVPLGTHLKVDQRFHQLFFAEDFQKQAELCDEIFSNLRKQKPYSWLAVIRRQLQTNMQISEQVICQKHHLDGNQSQ